MSDETHLWAETYERDLGDILKLQSEVAKAIAGEIQVNLAARERRRLTQACEVPAQAYEDYLKGRHFWNKRTEDGMHKSIDLYERAIKEHPGYAHVLREAMARRSRSAKNLDVALQLQWKTCAGLNKFAGLTC